MSKKHLMNGRDETPLEMVIHALALTEKWDHLIQPAIKELEELYLLAEIREHDIFERKYWKIDLRLAVTPPLLI